MVTISGVEFSYNNQPIFSDLNLTLNDKDFIFLIGKSGSGKSTLLQLIYMNILPLSGIVQVEEYNSQTIKKRNIPKLRRRIGVVFQDFKLLEDRNVYDNLAFILEVTNSRKNMKKKILQALSEVGLTHKQKNFPNQLSGGEKQRVTIARAIVNEPKIVLADEPTGNLDPETSAEILNIFERINSHGASVIFATHNYDLVKKSSAKIYKIQNGKLIQGIRKTQEHEA